MKKRILGLALVVGIVLSLCASAWAYRYEFSVCEAEYSQIHRISNTNKKGKPISIAVALRAAGYDDNDTTAVKSNLPQATELKVSLSDTSGCLTNGALSNTSYSLTGSNLSTEDTLSGTVSGNAGTIIVTAQLYNGTAPSGSAKTTSIVFDTNDADDETNPNYPTGSSSSSGPYSGVPTYDDDDDNALADSAADPDSENWNGLDPTFGTKGGNAKKEKPKIATSKPSFSVAGASAKALTAGTADTFKVEIKGPSPVIDVYVAAKDAIKLGWLAKGATNNIRLDSADIKKYAIPFRVTSYDISKTTAASQDKNTTHSVTIAYNGAHVAYKGFPITVAAENNDTSKAVTKTYKIDINSGHSTPQWVDSEGHIGDAYSKEANADNGSWTKKNAADVSVCFTDGDSVSTTFTVSGDAPYSITQKGLKADSGLTVTVTSPDLNKWGEVVTPGYVTISGAFKAKDDKDALKEHKAAITLTATGNVKKAAAKANIIGKISPYFEAKKITSKDVDGDTRIYLTGLKRVNAGKVPSVKFAAKGSKTIAYELVSGADELADHNLSFDAKKGAVVILDKQHKEYITPTIGEIEYTYTDEDGEEQTDVYTGFKSMDICVRAYNDVGETEAWAEVAITGAKPKFETKKLTISRDAIADYADGEVLWEFPIELQTAEDVDYQECTFSLADTRSSADLKAVGLGLYVNDAEPTTEAYLMVISSKDIKATKGVKANINASCYGAVAKGGVTIAIADPAPEISADSKIAFTSLSKDTTGKTITLGLKEAPTGDTKLTWKLKTKPTNKAVNAKFTAARDGKSATLNVTIKNDLTAALTDKAVITVTNAAVKPNLVDEFEVTITAAKSSTSTTSSDVGSSSFHAAVIDENAAAPEAEAEDDESAEPTLTFGKPRTAANITAAQQAFLQSKGYTVIAVLPEVTSDKDGQAEVAVELIEDAPEGAKLVYVPFPKNAAETEDDKIADFFDEEGAAIETVPAEKNITVAPWFRAGVTYEPVIAAEK